MGARDTPGSPLSARGRRLPSDSSGGGQRMRPTDGRTVVRSDGSCWMTNGSKGYARESLKRTGSTSPGRQLGGGPTDEADGRSDGRTVGRKLLDDEWEQGIRQGVP